MSLPERMNRRAFLHLRNLARQAGQVCAVLDEIDSIVDAAAPALEVPLLRARCRAMATQFEVLLPYGHPEANGVFQDVFGEIDRLEQQLTVYSESSEVSTLNQRAPFMAVKVEKRLFGLLELAKNISTETQGAFD